MATVIQSHRLGRAFINRYPKEAAAAEPELMVEGRHPEKFFFFFRKTSLPLLRKDKQIWRMRQQLKWLSILSLLIPPLAMALLVIYG
jgi:hypothetical protein